MKRFFVEPWQIGETQIQIVGKDVNHIRNVLRMKPGDTLWISDKEKKEYNCLIDTITEEEILLRIVYVQESDFELPSRLILFQCLPKGDKMEWIIQKAVEVQQDDTPEILQRRVMEQAEWKIMPQAIRRIAEGKVRVENGKTIITE